jgi:hypothetical protein
MEFRLVLPTKMNDWLGAYAAASIPTHFIHYKGYAKVFWFCVILRKGFGIYKDYVDGNWDELHKNARGGLSETPIISSAGYFFDTGRNEDACGSLCLSRSNR